MFDLQGMSDTIVLADILNELFSAHFQIVFFL